ncbi:MAG: hypothetical protein JXR84_03610 [Anaerolineae bacterium]|nr:hypothetical protein [Anaerolineae bacterium]
MAKLTGILAIICLLLTVLWLGLLIADMATAGPLDTFAQVVTHAARLDWLFYATYLNAALITLAATALMTALHAYLKPDAPPWIVIGLVFTPIYGALNLVVYLSQVVIAPALLTLRGDLLYGAATDVLLRQVLQTWPESGMAFFNGLAYAVLSIPSILYGVLLWRRRGALRWSGGLLILNGVACILGVVGFLTGSAPLRTGTMAGGVFFLLALFPLSWGLLKR